MTHADTENLRSMRQMRDLDPVENAFRAVACLHDRDKARLADRFNAVFGAPRPAPITMRFAGLVAA